MSCGELRTRWRDEPNPSTRLLTSAVLLMLVAGVVYAVIQLTERLNAVRPAPQRALTRLTFDAGLQGEPTWSPDGRFIAYSSDKSGNFDIWVQPVGDGDAVQVTKSPAHEWQPDWSPDGSQMCFVPSVKAAGCSSSPCSAGASGESHRSAIVRDGLPTERRFCS